MTDKQLWHYRKLWATTKAALRAKGYSPKEAEAERHALHRQALGYDRSSAELTNREFDLVKKAFLAISEPDRLDTSDGERTRRLHVVAVLCAEVGVDDDYLQAIIDRMNREGRIGDPWGEAAARRLAARKGGADGGTGDLFAPQPSAADLERARATTPRRKLVSDLSPGELDKIIVALRLRKRQLAAQPIAA